MCGILGQFSNSGINKNKLIKNLEITSNRGPDNLGYWISKENNLFLGSNRLSIQDLSENANMPFITKDEKYVVIYNGELYNFKELRQVLTNKGYHFQTSSDTEVLLNSYLHFGPDCVKKFEGMFSFCIYDREKRILFLARDIVGQKPLYYSSTNKSFNFSSHLNQLIDNGKINLSGLSNYLMFGYTLNEETLVNGIKKLLPGHYLKYNINNGDTLIKQFWSINQKRDLLNDESEIVFKLDQLLNNSVKSHLISDRKSGVLLSGGIDSSLIAYYASLNSSEKIDTYNVSFDGFKNYNESANAKKIAKFLDTNHHEINGNDINYDMINPIIKFMGEPIADSSIIPTALIYSNIKNKSTVLLGGDGGDELFGGYPSYINNSFPIKIDWFNRNVFANLPMGLKGRNYLLRKNSDNYILSNDHKYFSRYDIHKVFKEFDNELITSDRIINTNDFVYDMTKKDLLNYFSEDILVKVDRASMLSSIEARSPFLDKSIIEFALLNIPSNYKVNNKKLKYLLKNIFSKKIKLDYDFDRKQGFSIPIDFWVRDIWYDDIKKDILELPDEFDKKFLINTLKNIKKGYSNSSNILSIAFLSKWLKINKVKF
jgi:asparagine synthase (glutamine-hydrolysing)